MGIGGWILGKHVIGGEIAMVPELMSASCPI